MKLLFLALLFCLQHIASAQQLLSNVKISNCSEFACSRLTASEVHRSTLNLGLMAFDRATLEITTPDSAHKILQTFEAEDGYFDLQQQVIVMRGLKNSKHKELIYNVAENKILYF